MPEWAQLKAGAVVPAQLERGRWYTAIALDPEGDVEMALPDGHLFFTRRRLVRMLAYAPDRITRVQATSIALAPAGAPERYYGVCPKGHRVASVTVAQTQAYCQSCPATYPVEDEEQVVS